MSKSHKKNRDKGKKKEKRKEGKIFLKLKLPSANVPEQANPQSSSTEAEQETSRADISTPEKLVIRLPGNAFRKRRLIQPDEDSEDEESLISKVELNAESGPSNPGAFTTGRFDSRPSKRRTPESEYQRQYRAENIEAYTEYQSQYRAENNNEARAQYQREYRATNIEAYTDYQRNYRGNQAEQLSLWEATRQLYEKKIRSGPTVVCVCCGGLFFIKNVSLFSKEDMQEKWNPDRETMDAAFWTVDHNIFDGLNNITIRKSDNSQKYYFCENCKITIKKNKIPTIALMKNLHFPTKVACIEKMTRLEERLVAPRHFFQSIFTHKGLTGQYKSKGGIVNVPVTVDTTVNSLPRNLDATNTIHVSLARKMSFKKDYIKGNIDSSLVWEVAQYIKNTSLFIEHDIVLTERGNWEEVNGYNDPVVTDTDDIGDGGNNNGDNGSNFSDDVDTTDPNVDVDNNDPEPAENNSINDDVDDAPINVLATDSLIDNNITIRLAPGEGKTSISLIKDKDSDFLSFIKIFCGEKLDGAADISYSSLTKSMARRFDRRAVNRADYLLYMDRKSQLLKMASNISTILRKRKSNSNDDQLFTVKDVANEDYVNNLLNKDQAYKTFSGIRSSPEYWKNQKKNCMAMIRQLGVPTLFVTVSAAETKWNELLVMLKKVVDDDAITEDQADELTYNEKARLIQSDPVTTARYFDHRFRELKKTWSKDDGPFGEYKLIDYFFRVEFQHRGSPHVHMILWLEDAPFLPDKEADTPEEAEAILDKIYNFVDSMYTCSREWDGTPHHDIVSKSSEETWKDLIKTRQTHKHTSTCRRKRGGDKITCRFNIPFFPMKYTMILFPLDTTEYTPEKVTHYKNMYRNIQDYLNDNCKTLAESNITFGEFLDAVGVASYDDYLISLRVNLKLNKIYLKRKPNEIMINNYSRKILSMFRSNMDIQYILDPYACCAYVLDYINKADRGTSKEIEDMYNKHKDDPNSRSFDMLKSLAATYYNASEISAQEAAYNLLGIRMVEASVITVFIPTGRPEARTHILKSQNELDKLADNSTDCFVAGLLDHYVNRPEELDNITLAQFGSYFEISLKPFKKTKASQIFDDTNEDLLAAEEDNADTNADDNRDGNVANSDDIIDTTTISFGPAGKVFALKNESGFIKRRQNSKVIRYYKFNIEDSREDYFRVLIMLYLPWRDECDELLNINPESVFNENLDSIIAIKNEFCKIDDVILDGYMSQLNDENNAVEENDDEEENGTASNQFYDRENDFRRYTTDVDDASEGDYHRTNDLNDDLDPGHSSRNNSDGNNTYLEKVTLPDRLSKTDYQNLTSKLNLKQREYLMHIINHIRYNRERDLIRMFNNTKNTVKTFEPFYHFVTGGAGVGKSMLIKALYESLVIEFNRDRDLDASTPTVMLTASTGKAAFNIKGQTLHGAFMLPVSQFGNARTLSNLSPSMLHSMTVALKDLQVLIIDEISMVGTTVFSWVDMRLKHLFDASLPFGGKSVIVLGDFNQLPPVAAKPLYSTKVDSNPYIEMFGVSLWKDLFVVHKLEQIMRQRDDLAFAVALNNMAVGKMTPTDVELFQSRVLTMTNKEMQLLKSGEVSLPHLRSISEGTRPICLFHSNNEVRRTNSAILQSMDTEYAMSVGFDRVRGTGAGNAGAVKFVLDLVANDSLHQLQNLSLIKNLNLRVDARYMITSNIDTSDGLVNGSTGYLKGIDHGTIPGTNSSKPVRIWLEFDEELSGSTLRKNQVVLRQRSNVIDDKWTMIEPVSINIYNHRSHNLTVNRKQFPIVPAEALTTHKSQGGTYQNVVVYDTGKLRMSRSLLYVACSRATTASGLTLICKNNQFIKTKSLENEKSSDLYKESQRQLEIALNPVFACISTKNNFRIMSHNVQSINAHLNQIINDQVYLSSDIILLNETWTLSSDNFEIPGFHLAAAVHCPNSTRKALGSCCYITNSLVENITYSESKLFTYQQNNSSVSVSMVLIQDNLYCSVYASPSVPLLLLLQAMGYILEQSYTHIVIAGDFNVDFVQESSKKTALLRIFNMHGLKSCIPSYITSTTKGNTFIDNIFTNQDTLNSGRYISLTSYHEPLWVEL